MKKILITGASGFIGSFLVEKALKEGWETWAGVRKTSNREYLNDKRIHFIDLKYSDKGMLVRQLQSHVVKHGKWDYIVHNAGVTKCVRSADFTTINTLYMANLVEALQDIECVPEKFIFISSLSAMLPDTAYGFSKFESEQYLLFRSNLPYIILRPTGVYGPREKDYLMVLKTVKAGFNLTAGLKPQQLTFVYVTDLVQAVFLALKSNITKRTYTVSDGEVYTDSEYTKLIKQVLDKKTVIRIKIPLFVLYIISCFSELFFRIQGKTSTLNRDKFKIMKQRNWHCTNLPLVEDFDFSPEYDLEKGLKASVEWYKQKGWL